MKIAIIGAGNAGCAHAFKLTEQGHEVNLIKSSDVLHEENYKKIKELGGIWAIDHTNNDKTSFQKLNIITKDLKEGLDGVEILLILTQSLQHEYIAKIIKPFINNNLKMILVIPGNLGSVIFRNIINNDNIIIGEGESTPFDARIVEPGLVSILFKNVRNKLGFIPKTMNSKGLSLARLILDTYTDVRTNVVESALHNPNLIVHTVGVIMSAARIEYSKGEFWMYREAFTDSIWNLIDALDEEKNNVIKAYGGKPSPYLDECKYRNEEDLTKNSLDVFKYYANKGGPKGPNSLQCRYLYEDVPNGLCLLSNLAQKAGIKTPVCNALITIASKLVKQNFWEISRNLKVLGWDDLTIDKILKIL
jgi:opine dehydrogenase